MNHWKMCLQCWIPVSKKNDKTSVINAGADTETEDLDRLSSISLDPVPQFPQLPIPYRRSSAVEDSHFWTPPPPPPPPPPSTQNQTQYAGDTSENYIALDECHSGVTRGVVSRVPKLVSRDIHLLDRVPPSPCSLAENPGTFPSGVGGMREVYAPMLPSPRSLVGGGGPPGLSPRTGARGSEGPSRRTQQVTGPPYAMRDVHELQGPVEGSPSPGHHRVADLRNNNNNSHNGGTCFSFKAEHVRLANSSRSDSRTPPTRRVAYSSVSSDAAASPGPTDPTRPCCPSRPITAAIATPDSHSSVAATSARSETLPHRNVHRAVDRPCVVYQQSLPLTVREISDRRQDRSGPSTPRLRTDSGGEVSRSRCGGCPAIPAGGDGGGGAVEAGIDGPSLDSKMLHMTPPAPLPSNNGGKLKAHRYVNANGSSSGQRGPDELQDLCCQNSATPGCPNHAGSLPSSGPQTATNDSDGYYNLIPTSNNQATKTENGEPSTPPPPLPPPCHGPSSSRKKQFRQRPHVRHDSPHRRSPISVALPRRAKLEWNRSADDSSSSNDDDGSSSGFSATNSNTSLNRPSDAAAASLLKSFTTKPPAPSLQQPRIEYLQLDLDQPITVTRGSPGPVHRSQNSTIDYIEIDPRRTKALSDTKRQLESNRHKTSH